MSDFDNILKEGQQFLKMRQDFQKSSNPDAGTVGYLISLQWVNSYKKYIYYDALKRNLTPEAPAENDVVEKPG